MLDLLVNPPKPVKPTVQPFVISSFMGAANDWLKAYQSKGISDGRKRKAQRLVDGRFKAAFDNTPIRSIDIIAINAYLNTRLETAAFDTVRIERQYLAAIFKLALREGKVRWNPVDDYAWPKGASNNGEGEAIRTLTFADLATIIQHVPDATDKACLELFYRTGCRKQELTTATFKPVHGAKGRVLTGVVINGDGIPKLIVTSSKTHKTRKIPLSPQAVKLVEQLRQSGRDKILPDVSINHWYYTLRLAARLAGFDTTDTRINIHGLRHAFCSYWANRADTPLATVRDWAGHSSLAVTNAYIRQDVSKSDALMQTMED